MMTFKEITLDLRPRYEELSKGTQIANLRFPVIFMARNCSGFGYAETEGGMVIASRTNKMHAFALFPFGSQDLEKTSRELAETLGYYTYAFLTKQMADRIEAECPGMFLIEEDRNNWEYLYETDKLISLSGKKYHSKRNFIRRFEAENIYRYVELDEGNVHLCLPELEQWFQNHEGMESTIFDERQAICELISNFSALNLKGGAIEVDGRIRAFSFGEIIPPATAHIIIEKADASYQGLYPLMNREFLSHAWAHTARVNREEDMGLEGLRKSKLSYRPVGMNEVYRAKLIQK